MGSKFSIIIPVYNVAPYLEACLRSVMDAAKEVERRGGQWNVEVVCVDDGSTDGSGEILDDFGRVERGERVGLKVMHQQNRGVSVARNMGLMAATGEYVGFVDGDDIVAPDWFARFADEIERSRPDVVRANYTTWDEGTPLPAERPCGGKDIVSGGQSVRCLIRRSLLKDNGIIFPEGMRICEDTIFLLSVYAVAGKSVEIDSAGYFYRMRTTSAYHGVRRAADFLRLVEEIRPYGSAAVEKMLSRHFVEWLEYGVREDRQHDDGIRAVLSTGVVRPADLARHYRLGLAFFEATGSMALFYLMRSLAAVYRKVRYG